ncbi:hypothetical protein [Niveibacterium sp. SC-1]|uniref:hypothetical protein n=1 Tax=Niveibacterium sp. SC-1 TaxID=3135646 RepID=UPI00311E3F46
METCRLIALTACVLLPPAALAEELKLPQTSDQYKELLQHSEEQSRVRIGTVVQIMSETEARKGARPVETNPSIETVQGEPQLQPVTVAGKGAKQQRKDARDTKVTKRKLLIRWPDNTLESVDLSEGQSFKSGDRVVLRDGVVERAP